MVHAQVLAQGVVLVGTGEHVWSLAFHGGITTPVEIPAAGPTFVLPSFAPVTVTGRAALSHRDNGALTLSAEHGLGIADIASELGVTTGAAKVILHRARQRLLKAIA